MTEDFYNEKWKPYSRHERDNWKEWVSYEISNYGRVKNMKNPAKPKLVNMALTSGYPVVTGIMCNDEKRRSFYIHHAVAELFLPPKEEDHVRIMKLDHDKKNNKYTNLKWVTFKEWVAYQKKFKRKTPGYAKLTERDVALIKKKMLDPNRKTRIRILAKRYGVSEMQLYRIKSGENWGHVRPAK